MAWRSAFAGLQALPPAERRLPALWAALCEHHVVWPVAEVAQSSFVQYTVTAVVAQRCSRLSIGRGNNLLQALLASVWEQHTEPLTAVCRILFCLHVTRHLLLVLSVLHPPMLLSLCTFTVRTGKPVVVRMTAAFMPPAGIPCVHVHYGALYFWRLIAVGATHTLRQLLALPWVPLTCCHAPCIEYLLWLRCYLHGMGRLASYPVLRPVW